MRIKKDNPQYEAVKNAKQALDRYQGSDLHPTGKALGKKWRAAKKRAEAWEAKNTSYMTGKRLKSK